jgi:hypothetical protein
VTVSYTLRKTDVSLLIRELKQADKSLFNQMRKDFRTEIRPYANDLKSNIPGASPLSGFSRGVRKARTTASPDERSPFVWKKPGASIDVGSRSKGRRRGRVRSEPVIRIRFTDKRPFSAFSIMETARIPGNWRGANMLRGLEKNGYGPVGKGRWVIKQFYDQQPEIIGVARRVLNKWANIVSRRLARRF